MECPYCGKTMWSGSLPNNRYGLYWQSNEVRERREDYRIVLNRMPPLNSSDVEAFYCPDCRKVIVPVPEPDRITDAVSEICKETAEKVTAFAKQAQTKLSEQWAEKKEQRKWSRRKGKDPWEW